MVFLVGVSAACFWIAIAAVVTPPPPPHKGAAANTTDANGAGGAGGGAGGGPAAGSSRSSSGASGGTNSSTTSTAANALPCQAKCQTAGSSCQSTCYQQYNVTNQTQYWSQCMQGCGTKLSVCSNNCISGVTLPPISTVLPPPPPAAAISFVQPTRSPPPPAQPDDSSSSSSRHHHRPPPRGTNDGCRRRWRSSRNVFLPCPSTLKSHAVSAVAFGTNAVSLERPDLYFWSITAFRTS